MAHNRRDPAPRPPRALQQRVRRYAVERDLFRSGACVLVAVSGGPDSTCLLLVLAALRRSLGIELVAAHFDHGLRGRRAAARELRVVRSIAEALDVALVAGTGDVRAHARSTRRSVEDAARELRYGFLRDVAHDQQCTAVAVGHTRDDQAETVLLHVLRGSGLRGLAAMTPSSRWPLGGGTPRLVRPLLALSRVETESCCAAAGVEPVEDPSNRSRAFRRNRIRHELLPLLRTFNPRIDEALSRLAETAAADVEAIDEFVARALAGARVEAGTVRVSRRRLRALPEALQRHAVRAAVAKLIADERGLGERHVRALVHAAAGRTGAQLDLPRGVRAEVRRDALVLTTAPARPERLPARPKRLAVPGETTFGAWQVEADVLERGRRRPAQNGLVAHLDADACGEHLRLRRRREGDRFQPLGLARSKKLQDFFIDAHVPREERDALPVVEGARGIAWVVGGRPAEWAKITPRTGRVLRLRALRKSA